jgi:hypothetical protein
MAGLIDQLASGIVKQYRADEALRKSKQKERRGKEKDACVVIMWCR